ncbi:protein kinase domain-containing protein [Pyxidicoccus sp. 3LG]
MSEPGTIRFGKYELLERLGAGGMAVVHRALYTAAPGVTKPVVIKRVLGTHAEDPSFVEMFLNEARISVGLSHGNIVQVFDFGQVGSEYFLAMELVDGHPLGRVLKAARAKGLPYIPAPLAVGIAIEMCRGLHHAHTRLDARGEPLGVVHRDLSPDNVLMSYEGEVKLTDFGIAKARLAGRPETEVGIVKGKYLYFSPEQARGHALDARSDVYTVGTVLYQMLCGQRPVDGTEFEVMRRIAEGELTPALSLNPTLDTDLQGILKLALATSREKRFLSAEAMQQALSDWLGFRAPRFPANARKHFMGWLFQEELTARKRAPQLPSDFLAQLQSWRGRGASAQPPPTDTPRALTPLSPPRAFQPAKAVDVPGTGPTWSSARRSSGVKAAAGALVVGVAAATVLWMARAPEQQEPAAPAPVPALATATPEAEPHEPEPAPPATTASAEAPSPPPPEEGPASDTPSAPDETHLALENGTYWLSRGDDSRALGWFQQCVRHDSSQARCHLELARIYARRGARQDALKHFTHHLAIESDGLSAEEARRYLKLYAGMDPP